MNNMKAGDESFMASVMVLNTNLIAEKQQNGTKWNGIKMQQLVYMVHPLSCAYILHLYACVMILLLLTTGAVGIEITPSKDQVHVAFENVSGICTFTCSGNGAYVVWTVDESEVNTPHVLNKGISVLPTVVSSDGRNITSRLSVPTIKSNNNTSVVCTVLNASLRNPQPAGPVILLIQGILEPPRELKIHVDVHVSNNMSWIAPSSYDVSPAAIFHYVLSNNVSNVSEIIRSSCGPSIPCTASLDLNDPLLLLSHNTSILEYNGTIEFTYYAVNGAGNGIATTYLLRPSPGNGISTHPVPTTASGIANTNITTYITVQTNNTNDKTKIIALTLSTTVIVVTITIIIITFIAIKKYKKSIVTPPADLEHGSKTNEYIQTLCVTQQDDPYHVIVPRELRKLPPGHHNEPGATTTH